MYLYTSVLSTDSHAPIPEDGGTVLRLLLVKMRADHCWPSLFADGSAAVDPCDKDKMQRQFTLQRLQEQVGTLYFLVG